jgi:branched-chain amino acid transport system permease protein
MKFQMQRSTLFFIGLAILLFLIIQALSMPLGGSRPFINEFWLNLIRMAGIMAILALGLNLIYGFNGQFSLGQFGFYAIGAYAAADVTYRWTQMKTANGMVVLLLVTMFSGIGILVVRRLLTKVRGLDSLSAFTMYLVVTLALSGLGIFLGAMLSPTVTGIFNALPAALSMQIMYIMAVLLGGILAAEISFLFGVPVLSLGSDYFGIATLGFTIIVKVLLDNSDTLLGFEEMKGARGMVGIPKLTSLFWVFIFLLIIIIVTRNLLHSSYGRAIISVREDEIAAKTMGIDIGHYKILTFVLGSFFAGIAGGLYAHNNAFLVPSTFNFIRSFDPMIIIVFGGLGSVTGTIAASFIWALGLEGVLRTYMPQGAESWRYVVYPLLLLLLMLLRPKGLFGDFELPFLRQGLPPLKPTAPERIEQDIPPATVTATPGQAAQPDAPQGANPAERPASEVTE